MKLIRKTICLHGDRKVYVLTPERIGHEMTVTDDNKGYFYMLSNGTGYAPLSELFASAISLENNELIHLPLPFEYLETYKKDFPELENHCSGIVVFNYCTTRIVGRNISAALKSKAIKEAIITRNSQFSDDFPDRWKTHHRLTVKKKGSLLIMSGNSDIFTSLAQSCASLAEYGDDANYNNNPPHMHHDWDENTAKSVGITLYYWHHYKGGLTDELLSSR